MTIKETNTEDNNMQKRLNLKNDIVFKAFFAKKGNEKFLIDFLEPLLKIKINNIKIQEEKNLLQLTPNEKGGRLDLEAELNDGVVVNIELQMKNNYNMKERLTFYGAKKLTETIEIGQNYNEMKKVIVVAILGYNLLDVEDYISETKIVLEKHRDYEVINNLKWYFIELPKFRKIHPNMDEKLNQWIALIDDYDRGLIKMAEEKNKTIEKAKVEIQRITGDEIIRRRAWLEEKWKIDRNSELSYAKTKGKEEGIKEGEKNKQIEIVKRMLKEKMPIDMIEKITELTKEEIKQIQDKL